jgi:MoaA/NifB/PqqE/SkfB family radical SAM enzyme
MEAIKGKYLSNGWDFFTDEYYEILNTINNDKCTDINRTKTFRESSEESLYQNIAIEITQENHCQLACEWCYINQMKEKNINKPLEFEVVKNIIDKIVTYSKEINQKVFSNIVFIGGEPTLNNDLEKMILYSLENNLKPIVVTNSFKLANMDYARKICVEDVTITTHIPFCKNEYDYDDKLDELCRCNGYSYKLKKAIDNMLELRQSVKNFDIIGEFVVNKATIEYAYNSYKYCRKNDITPFFELMRISDDSNINKNLLLEQKDIIELSKKLYELDVKNNIIADNNIMDKIRYFLPPTINNPCTIAQNSIHIKFTEHGFGNVTSCCGQDIFHGNIQVDSLDEILKNKENTNIFSKQDKYIEGPCSICELYFNVGCQGGCRGNAQNTYDCPKSSDPQCIFIKEKTKLNINEMTKKNCKVCDIANCKNNINSIHKLVEC